MIPRRIFGANRLFGPPRDWDEQQSGPCTRLHVRINPDAGTCASAWEPTPEELAALNAGGSIVLTIHGGQPPVSLHVETPEEDGS